MAIKIKNSTVIDDDKNIVGANTYNGYVPVSPNTSITAANGIIGGGDFSSSRSISVRAADGINVNTSGVSVDATVVRTSGRQTLEGKDFNTNVSITSTLALLSTNTSLTNVFVTNGTSSNSLIIHSGNTNNHSLNLDMDSGTLTANIFSGSGANLMNLNANNITQGTVPDGRISSSLVRAVRRINSGNGLNGGGDLSSDLTLNVVAGNSMSANASGIHFAGNTNLYTARTIFAGDGLSGGGDLSADRTLSVYGGNSISVNTSGVHFVGNTNSFHSRTITTGNGLSGGGNLSTDRTLSVDGGNSINVNTSGVHFVGNTNSYQARTISTGNGLSGGGDLSANRTLSVDGGNSISVNASGVHFTGNTNSYQARTISTGNGLSGGGDLSADRTLSVDSTVLRTTGNYTMSGTLTVNGLLKGTSSSNSSGEVLCGDGNWRTSHASLIGSNTVTPTAVSAYGVTVPNCETLEVFFLSLATKAALGFRLHVDGTQLNSDYGGQGLASYSDLPVANSTDRLYLSSLQEFQRAYSGKLTIKKLNSLFTIEAIYNLGGTLEQRTNLIYTKTIPSTSKITGFTFFASVANPFAASGIIGYNAYI